MKRRQGLPPCRINREVIMKIESYAVKASSQREYMQVESATTRVVQRAIAPPAPEPEKPEESEESSAKLDLSSAAKHMMEKTKENNERFLQKLYSARPVSNDRSRLPSNPLELKLTMLEQLFYVLTGKRFRAQLWQGDAQGNGGPNLEALSGQTITQNRPATGTFIETESFFYESESVSYQAQGVIQTADGKTINVDVSLSMSREYMAYSSASVQMKTQAVDPLVINYGGSAASLTGEKFAFDLDVDGSMDLISSLGEGSGFLALDKNRDDRINDGSELFGPNSGSGFGELRAYDQDGNGWIDENDDVFFDLLVWSKDKDGSDQLFALKELDIGAIYLGDIATEFSLTGDDNESYGTMRSTSFFLKESGGAGTISHIDLTL